MSVISVCWVDSIAAASSFSAGGRGWSAARRTISMPCWFWGDARVAQAQRLAVDPDFAVLQRAHQVVGGVH
ncbi:hypothetical protein ABZ342_46945, partial [Amycolatopsis sp. NPDC005961]|uniref:hypothetical protein n=1 Tax=Amycolatopsis sp. NPDC005961 TaxID=3156720 RepID=UPI00341091EC